ncbi:hypothetical protein [Sedimenticola thiotaurini]|uniref:hypothetical protein n=1 Tax=Sedimenticola thiotaurini TaxID=1543721 RepID=UPI0019009AE2|nr:hypothetical protein [Sedimenticola thiotaurini]
MTKEGQGRFKVVLFIWWLGLIASNGSCELVASLEWVSRIVPAIDSFKLAAAPENACAADAMWTYAWLSMPVFFVWIIYLAYAEPTHHRARSKRVWGSIFFVGMFVVAFLASFYGVYEPYPGTGVGRWEKLYRGGEVGVIVITTVAWLFLYSSFLMFSIFISELVGIKRK